MASVLGFLKATFNFFSGDAIILSIVADALAAIPTLVKAWREPETENLGPYVAGFTSQLTAIAAFKLFTVSEIAFPLYLLLINATLVLVIKRSTLFKPAAR